MQNSLLSRALWNPDPAINYDLIRVTSEYKMMELFYNINPEAVAMLNLCLGSDDGMKLLVMQWSEPLSKEPTSSLMAQLCQVSSCVALVSLLHSCTFSSSF